MDSETGSHEDVVGGSRAVYWYGQCSTSVDYPIVSAIYPVSASTFVPYRDPGDLESSAASCCCSDPWTASPGLM